MTNRNSSSNTIQCDDLVELTKTNELSRLCDHIRLWHNACNEAWLTSDLDCTELFPSPFNTVRVERPTKNNDTAVASLQSKYNHLYLIKLSPATQTSLPAAKVIQHKAVFHSITLSHPAAVIISKRSCFDVQFFTAPEWQERNPK